MRLNVIRNSLQDSCESWLSVRPHASRTAVWPSSVCSTPTEWDREFSLPSTQIHHLRFGTTLDELDPVKGCQKSAKKRGGPQATAVLDLFLPLRFGSTLADLEPVKDFQKSAKTAKGIMTTFTARHCGQHFTKGRCTPCLIMEILARERKAGIVPEEHIDCSSILEAALDRA
jgi:hypothetical protein